MGCRGGGRFLRGRRVRRGRVARNRGNSGAAHARYRGAYTASIDAIDLHEEHSMVERIAIPLINSFCATSR